MTTLDAIVEQGKLKLNAESGVSNGAARGRSTVGNPATQIAILR
jgi:hypothetical protein